MPIGPNCGSWRCAAKVRFYLIHISNMLEVLDSSVNFLIYFACHRYFRPAVTRCQGLFVPAHRGTAVSDHHDTRSPAPAAEPDEQVGLQELLHDDVGETAADYYDDDYEQHHHHQQQQQQQCHRYENTVAIAAWSSDTDLSWRNASDDDVTTDQAATHSSTLPTE